MCYFLLRNSEIWLIDDDNLLLFLLNFSLVEREIGSMANDKCVSGCMVGESVNFKIFLAFSLLLKCVYSYRSFNKHILPFDYGCYCCYWYCYFYYDNNNHYCYYFHSKTQSNSSKPKWGE